MRNKILITGANGQLGHCLKKIAPEYQLEYDFLFADSSELNITDKDAVFKYFSTHNPNFCINAAAYTAVDLAETEKDKAFAVNTNGVANLSEACSIVNAIFIHVSTDYVFDGDTQISYDEDNFTNPQSIYGESKLQGEIQAIEKNKNTIILRTSWLYSEYNKNFVKTMLHLFDIKKELNVVADQFGQPTNANDLAEAIMNIISQSPKKFGIYHFSNYPETNWYIFAKTIAELSNSSIKIQPITTQEYPTPAKRPVRSTMSLDKIQKDYHIEPKRWENSLENCIETLKLIK